MNQISVPPGAFKFRLAIIVVLVLILMLVFMNYTNRIAIVTEKTSIQQTKNIINSTLLVVFANYTINGKLDRLNEVSGSNPFDYLSQYNLVPATYQGETDADRLEDSVPGWYYDRVKELAIYKPYHSDKISYFTIVLEYRDINESGRFEAEFDQYRRLMFKQLPQQ